MRVCSQVLAAVALELGLITRPDRRPLQANFSVVLRYEMTLVGISVAVVEVGALLLRWLWRGCYCCHERPSDEMQKVKSL